MELIPLEGNCQHLDGGALFGHVPKAVWSRWVAVAEDNRVKLACRALLIQDAGSNILFEAGIGAFFPPKMKERYGVEPTEHLLLNNLKKHSLNPEDIDHIILSHLHFDHAGGLLSAYQENVPAHLVFPKAHYWISQAALARAKAPHIRDKASYIPELPGLLEATGRLHLVEGAGPFPFNDRITYRASYGHTPGLLVVRADQTYMPSDLIPGTAWVHLPVTAAYDRYPELAVDEKKALLDEMMQNGGRLFLTHDPEKAFCQVVMKEGRYQIS